MPFTRSRSWTVSLDERALDARLVDFGERRGIAIEAHRQGFRLARTSHGHMRGGGPIEP